MDNKYNEDILKLAKMNVWERPKVQVLDDQNMDKYSFLISAIDSILKEKLKKQTLVLPELRENENQTIAIYSDYGGESPDSKYYTYSFLVCGYNHSFGFPAEINKTRQKYKLNNTEIAFKNFHYGPMRRALPEYLRAIDFLVVGILVTIIVDKRITTFFSTQENNLRELSEFLEKEELGSWKPAVAEKLFRIVHIISYFIGLLSKDGQKIFWMTDNDAIAPNREKHNLSINLLQKVLPLYTNNSFKLIGGATSFEQDGIGYHDFLSAADIAAGAVEQYFSRRKNETEDIFVKEGADKVLTWLCYDGIGLKKLNILIEKDKDGILASEIVFSEKKENKDNIKIYVPIIY
jgi:hypothetical protein